PAPALAAAPAPTQAPAAAPAVARDSDGDRIADVDDHCPNDAEIYNGYEDDDGCPDHGCVVVRQFADCAFESVFFQNNGGSMQHVGMPAPGLEMIPSSIQLPEVEQVAVRGHREAGERAAVSAERAAAVLEMLVAKGIARDKLAAVDAGVEKDREAGAGRR